MSLGIEEWYYRWAKGMAQSFVVRQKVPLEKVTKTLNTVLRDGRVSTENMERMLAEIESESVEAPYLKSQPYYSDRKKRLDQLKRMVHSQMRGKSSREKNDNQ